MPRSAVRVAAGVLVLVLSCVFLEARLARKNLWPYHELMQHKFQDPFAQNQDRFAKVRRDLPANRPVGYVSNIPRNEMNSRFLTEFVQAQFALAPHLVFDTDTLDPIVGDFPNRPPDFADLAATGLRVVHNYGHGVLLLSRIGP